MYGRGHENLQKVVEGQNSFVDYITNFTEEKCKLLADKKRNIRKDKSVTCYLCHWAKSWSEIQTSQPDLF